MTFRSPERRKERMRWSGVECRFQVGAGAGAGTKLQLALAARVITYSSTSYFTQGYIRAGVSVRVRVRVKVKVRVTVTARIRVRVCKLGLQV